MTRRARRVGRWTAVGAATAAVAGWAHFRNWGSTPAERAMALPGDELVPGPASQRTLGVSIAAPSAQVWPWLVQVGQDRGGMYSYDWLENVAGLDIHSAGRIEPRWQHLQVGDRVRLVRAGWMGMPAGLSLPVARIVPGRSLVLREDPAEQPWDAVWSFHLRDEGPNACRLLSRSRSAAGPAPARVAAWCMEPVTALMTRRMLLGIRSRVEDRTWGLSSPVPGPAAAPAGGP